MHINIDEILVSRGKTRYWLAHKIEIAYPNLMKLCNNETQSIKFDILEKTCLALDCTPNDILKLEG